MQCTEIRNYFADYLAEELEPSTQEEFSRHLNECSECRAELEALTELWVKLGSVPAGPPASPDLDVRLRASAQAYEAEVQDSGQGRRVWKRLPAVAAIAAAIAIAVLIPVKMFQRAPAILEDVTGSRKIEFGEVVRSGDAAGSVLVLADSSRVEMRLKSVLLLERADDGVRIRLRKGSVLVTAAKQHSGHLYVQTKDVTVSVIGTVFLVNAEEAGSRVAVIEGEVRVQRGVTEKKLRPGEQVSTSPQMEESPMKEEIAWSRHAEEHMALLRVSTRQNPPGERVAFEEASIRPHPGGGGGGGRGGSGITVLPNGCALTGPQIDPGRFAVSTVTLYTVIAWAAGANLTHPLTGGCDDIVSQGLISGGPDWSKSDLWDVEAIIPSGFASYTEGQLRLGQAPQLQRMILTLLEERFKLVVRREKKEVPAFALTAGKGALKFTVATELFPGGMDNPGFKASWDLLKPGAILLEGSAICGKEASLADLIPTVRKYTRRPIVDRTGLTRPTNFCLMFRPDGYGGGLTQFLPLPLLPQALEEQMGLKLEDAKTTVETWVIERAEKPTEN